MSARIASAALMALAGPFILLAASPALAGTPSADRAALAPTALVAMALESPTRRLPVAEFDAGASVKQGFNLLRRGKQEQAVKLFDKVITQGQSHLAGDARPRLCRVAGEADGSASVDPAICDAHFGKGYALIDLGRGDLAEAELARAAEMAPTNAHFANEYAELFKSRRDWQKSYEGFSRAWAVVDRSTSGPDASVAARALRGMGFSKAAMGAFDEAEALYTQSLQYDPQSQIARVELGNIARKRAIGS
ncbi:diguanylate cyclase [Novosphingobium sp. FGD1]|jgi:tetratricopeptide (TPR) repeat protein|uniref:Diguanylate cyclase n=1 Tax=Novosphingobium silvae TaxID=2692619 RepID=A0A7X4GGB0_9SPHN|nr:tetratricopeptide repeat protein [Novosphingobium silvae]MYL98085.1 diguanylate cyclase [Novosphingobium silvae]